MRTVLTRLHGLVDHPWTNLAVAVVLIASSLSEAGGTLIEGLASGDLRAHHGVLVFGLTSGVKALPEVFEGLNKLFHGPEADLPET